MVRSSVWLAAIVAAAWPAVGSAELWDGPKLKPAAPEQVYEFTTPPTFERMTDAAGRPVKDHYVIHFASKARCDAAVAVHDASGRIVRHVVYGVLGPNAPEPFKPDSLEQTVIWDGKDDAGRYVADPASCRARVSLGLAPTFDKVLNFHPKDTTAGSPIVGLAVDSQGAYVTEIESSGRCQLRMYDHDAKYVRTVWPFPADKFGAIRPFIKTRTVEEDGRVAPQLSGIGSLDPLDQVGQPNCLVAVDGRLGVFTKGGYGSIRRLLRLRNDGTTGGESIEGPIFMKGAIAGNTFGGPVNVAASPDGKWLYATSLSFKDAAALTGNAYGEYKPYRWNAVYRFAWEQAEPVTAGESFVGEVASNAEAGCGDDADHFKQPSGLAVDAAGRLYVCDTGNRRVQVFDTANGAKLVKSITGVANPEVIAIHQKTGEIYVLCFPHAMKPDTPIQLVKLSALPEAKPVLKAEFRPSHDHNGHVDVTPLMALDSWSARPRVWLVHAKSVVRVYEERGDKFELIDDFEKDVIAAGLRPRMLGSYGLNKLAADPVRGHLYYLGGGLKRCDPEAAKGLTPINIPSATGGPGGWQDLDVGTNGLLYLRALKFLARFDPTKVHAGRDGPELTAADEVPFDYGEPQDLAWGGGTLTGAIKIAALPGANSFDTGFGVGPYGDIVAFMKNYRTWDDMLWGRDKSKWVDAWGARNMAEAREGFQPRNFPGRNYNGGELVMRWTDRGEPSGDDLVPALPMPSSGIHLDRYGCIYLGIGANAVMANGKAHSGGCVAKFGPAGGKFFGAGDVAKLAPDELPQRPPEFTAYGWGKLWTKGMFWSYPGYDQQHFLGNPYPCLCASCRFDLDLYGRSFIPKAYQFTVGVLDTNGNRICEIGHYGNPDSPAMKPGDADIAIAHCSYLAVDSDRYLYLNDDGNNRIVRIKLGYRKELTAPLGKTAG